MSEAKTGRKMSAETRAKMSEAKTGRKHSAEASAKMSEAATRRHKRKAMSDIANHQNQRSSVRFNGIGS